MRDVRIGRGWWRAATMVLVLLCAPAHDALAQSARARWEIGGGAVWVGGVDFGRSVAGETRNPGTGSGPFDLFVTENDLDPVVGLQGRIAYNLTSIVAFEGGVRFTRPKLTFAASADAEEAPDVRATETLTQYLFDGSVVLHLTGLSFAGGRGVPFVAGGAGYVRDLHDGSELLETGTEYHGLAGLKLWFGDGRQRVGVRVEGGVSNRDGFDLSSSRRTVPVASGTVVYQF